MDIAVSKVIPIQSFSDYKIHFAVWNGENQPLDVFVRSSQEWKSWNEWRGTRNDFNCRYIFSLIRYYHRPEMWLFGGIFEVISRHADSYTVELCDNYKEYIGRLLIHYAGPGVRGRAFHMRNHFEQLIVAQIFEEAYSGEAFCGYESIEHGFSRLEPIFKQNKPDWKTALESIKGVYLIVDKKVGKMYVGSAYGESGIWSRWSCYIGTGHGWSDELTKLIREKGIEYARKYFQFSLLEFCSMKTDDNDVIDREQYWKRVLLTGEFGYNGN